MTTRPQPDISHTPATYPDGAEIRFRLDRASGSKPQYRATVELAALATLCTRCGAFVISREDRKPWGAQIGPCLVMEVMTKNQTGGTQ